MHISSVLALKHGSMSDLEEVVPHSMAVAARKESTGRALPAEQSRSEASQRPI